MEATTLITFMLQEPSATSVELFGSWDNFTAPWRMKHDARRGAGHWSGCHKFRNIVCDGSSSGLQQRRDGGLMMGGLYWYYYRINGEDDHYDPSQPSTNNCPLLPGHHVNILEVPWEKKFVSRSDSSSVAMITAMHTLNPDDRYRNPRPAPKPKLPRIFTRLDVSHLRSNSAAPPDTPSSAHEQRQVKSATHPPVNIFAHVVERVASPMSNLFPVAALRSKLDKLHSEGTSDMRITGTTHCISKSQISYPMPVSASMAGSEGCVAAMSDQTTVNSRLAISKWAEEVVNDNTSLLSQPPNHRRAVTAPDLRPVTQFIHRRTVSDETLSRPSPAVADMSRHSIARKPVAGKANFLSNVDSPTAKESAEPVAAPDSKSASEPVAPALGLNLLNLDVDISGSVQVLPPNHNVMNLDKQLPALPSSLVPSPLFSRSTGTNLERVTTEWARQQSRFSVWSVGTEDEVEEEEGHDNNNNNEKAWEAESGSDSPSLTFSDVDDSGHSSPMGVSDLFWLGASESCKSHDTPQETELSETLSKTTTATAAAATVVGSGENMSCEQDGAPGTRQVHLVENLTPLAKLMHEFEYMGAALI